MAHSVVVVCGSRDEYKKFIRDNRVHSEMFEEDMSGCWDLKQLPTFSMMNKKFDEIVRAGALSKDGERILNALEFGFLREGKDADREVEGHKEEGEAGEL